ncbi:zinc finger protein 54-like [Spodoptera frugiperda]|uniref:Zinc finger protein 54-like n=1 Tax=Spodoptera frugiperda TaxID=7108 RepID=A0A9R0DZR3_SPOFR|nr:zinc finger protein 54-like [Spodoptera frugiperda]
MNGKDSFNVLDMKNICQTCLKMPREVFPMTAMELNTYQNLTQKVVSMDEKLHICLLCKWIIRRCYKFTLQCLKANEILKTMEQDTKAYNIEPTSLNLQQSTTELHYIGPEYDTQTDKQADEATCYEYDGSTAQDDDDDDEIPLVMLQDDIKSKRRASFERSPQEIEIKLEPILKEEFIEDLPKERSKRKRKKEIREGFSSRMVQETEEYVVIKLSKEQVLSELAEKAKSDSYIRSPYKCEQCVKGFNFEDVLQTHMERHKQEHGAYKCDICFQYCPSVVSLRGHIKSHTTRYKCKVCGHVRLSRQNLLEHYAIAHTVTPASYTCDKCQFSTNKRTVIQRHVKTHSSLERHACHQCGKLFTTMESLRVHTLRHDKSKRLRCDRCDKCFLYPSSLLKHKQAHERDDYYCVECDVRFKTPENLRLHFKKAKRHRDSSSYRYVCAQCPLRFVSASSRAVHSSRAHGAPRTHACSACYRTYSSRDALRAHTWRVHQRAKGGT